MTFDIVDMVKKPLRSKHCRITDRCVARFDQYVLPVFPARCLLGTD